MIDFFRKTPFFRILIPFITGIIIRLYIPGNDYLLWIAFFILILSFIWLIFLNITTKKIRYQWIFGILTLYVFFICGYYLTHESIKRVEKQYFSTHKEIVLSCIITDTPTEKKNTCKFSVNVNHYWHNDSIVKCNFPIILYIEKNSNSACLKAGDVIQVHSLPQKIKSFPNAQGFDYAKYMFRQGIQYSAYCKANNWIKTDSNRLSLIYRLSFSCKDRFLKFLKNTGMEGNNLAVASALTIGYRADMDTEIKQAYSSTGTTHILAVSGMHVGLLYIILGYILSLLDFIKIFKRIKPIFLILIIWFYAFLSGMSPSIIRAALMLSFISFGEFANRQSFIGNSITSSAFIILLYNPMQISDVGFQLSYAAVIGIVLLYPSLNKLIYSKYKLITSIWQLIAVSIAAQVTTFPLTIYYFHQFPNYFILSNLLAIPISTLAMYSALILLVVAYIAPLYHISVYLLNFLINLLNAVVVWIEHLPFSITNDLSISEIEVILLYLLVSGFTSFIAVNKARFLIFSLTVILLWQWYQIISIIS